MVLEIIDRSLTAFLLAFRSVSSGVSNGASDARLWSWRSLTAFPLAFRSVSNGASDARLWSCRSLITHRTSAWKLQATQGTTATVMELVLRATGCKPYCTSPQKKNNGCTAGCIWINRNPKATRSNARNNCVETTCDMDFNNYCRLQRLLYLPSKINQALDCRLHTVCGTVS